MELLDYDHDHKIATYMEIEEDGDVQHIRLKTVQDPRMLQAIKDVNQERKSLGATYYKNNKDFWHAASIPCIVQLEWMEKYGINDVTAPEHQKKVAELLNSNEYHHLRTGEFIM